MNRLTVYYPANIFASDKLETQFYEQFVSNALRRGVSMLRMKGLPDTLTVDLSDDNQERLFAKIELLYRTDDSNTLTGYCIKTSAYLPPLLAAVCHFFFKSVASLPEQKYHNSALWPKMLSFFDHMNNAIAASRVSDEGITTFVKLLYEGIGLNKYSRDETWGAFDQCGDFFTCYEVAHAYTEQLSKPYDRSVEDDRSFEYIMDILAIDWLYQKWVLNTPDDEEYRKNKGFGDYQESVKVNSLCGVYAIVLILIFQFICNVIKNEGMLTMQSSKKYPHLLMRFYVQYLQFTSLISGNPHNQDLPELDGLIVKIIGSLSASHLLNYNDIDSMLSQEHIDDVERVRHLADTYEIKELEGYKPFLSNFVNIFSDMIKKIKGSR